jgi:transcriptional regulator with XRE-family HTH domain
MVKALRTEKGWTQETLAELSGLQTRTIQRVEQGQSTSIHTCCALGRAFEFDDIEFFNELKGNSPRTKARARPNSMTEQKNA